MPKAEQQLPAWQNATEALEIRKRRLLKGPSVFRDVRIDRAKKK
jgi:hypothetical protein